MKITRHITIAGILLAAGVAQATEYTVPSAATPTLEFALESPGSPVQDGDTLILTDQSTYFTSYTVSTPNLTIRAAEGHGITINALALGSVFEVGAAGSGLTLEGFTMRNGFASQGGAVNIQNATVTIRDCAMEDNVVTDDGGAIVAAFSNVTIERCLFERNSTQLPNTHDDGGAIHASDGTNLTITDSVFRENSAFLRGGAVDSVRNAVVTISRCLFENNSSATEGGALGFAVGARGTVTDSIIRNNTAGNDGGGIFCDDSWPDLFRCVIVGNSAGAGGGGVAIEGETLENMDFFSCVIGDNTAQNFGGGIVVNGGPDSVARNCTIVGNRILNSETGVGGGIAQLGGAAAVIMRNCILRDNVPTQYPAADNRATYCNVSGGEFTNAVGTINEDPMFVDAAGGDFRLMEGSPSIDAGDATYFNTEPFPTDLDGNPRVLTDPATSGAGVPIMALFVDQGAYEFQPVVAGTNPCVADLTTTGATLPGTPGFAVPDGVADADDLGYFLNFWLEGCP